MHKGQPKKELKKQLNALFKSMDFRPATIFSTVEKMGKKQFQVFFNIYQQLGLAWEFLGLQCKHWTDTKKRGIRRKPAEYAEKSREQMSFISCYPGRGPKNWGEVETQFQKDF